MWAYQRHYLDHRPHIELPRSHAAISTPKFLTREQVGKFLDAAEEPWRTWILVAVRTGLRCGELLLLHRVG